MRKCAHIVFTICSHTTAVYIALDLQCRSKILPLPKISKCFSKLFETDDNSLHDTSYNIYNIAADAENGQKEEENVYDVADEPTGPPPPPIDAPTAPLSTPLSSPVVEEEM